MTKGTAHVSYAGRRARPVMVSSVNYGSRGKVLRKEMNKMDRDLVVSSSDESWEVTEGEEENTSTNAACSKQCYWCEQGPCARKTMGHVWCSCECCIQVSKCMRPPAEGAASHGWNEGRGGLRRRPGPGNTVSYKPTGSTYEDLAEGNTNNRTSTRGATRTTRNRGSTASRGRAAVDGTIGQGKSAKRISVWQAEPSQAKQMEETEQSRIKDVK